MVTDSGIFEAYYDCVRAKRSSIGAMNYFSGMEEDLLSLADEINQRTYQPSTSTAFIITSPKRREVFAACFRDRVVHHYLMLRLEPLFERFFGERTFNCRKGKGVLFGIKMLQQDIKECSANYSKDCWIMKMDLKGFFMSIDKSLLNSLLKQFIAEYYQGEDVGDLLFLTEAVVMHSPEQNCIRRSPLSDWEFLPLNKSLFTNGDGLGMPIGNLSSQHFANFLLSYLDKFIDSLWMEYHGRYVDDFYIVHNDKQYLLQSVAMIRRFLKDKLHITLHPNKFYIQHYSKGVTFTGAIVKYDRLYPAKRTVRNFYNACQRMNQASNNEMLENAIASVNSYLGLMIHMNSYAIRRKGVSLINSQKRRLIVIKGHYQSLALAEPSKHHLRERLIHQAFYE